MVAGSTVVGSSPTSSSILAYSVTVSTKHFDCFSLGSNPSKPTNKRVVEESGLSRWPWTLEHAGSNPAYPTITSRVDGRVKVPPIENFGNCPYNLTAKVLYF